MPLRASRIVPVFLRFSHGLAAQVAASVIAAFCVTAITESYLKPIDAQDHRAATTLYDPAPTAEIMQTAFTAVGVRSRARYPVEFETILGPTTLNSFALFASSAWPSEPAWTAEEPRLVTASSVASHVRTVSLAATCRTNCRPRVVADAPSVAAMPPVRLTSLDGIPGAQSSPSPQVRQRRANILGVDLPGFVPTGDVIVKTVASLADKVVELVPRI